MSRLQFSCPFCEGVFEVDDALAGQQVACPLCGGLVGVPGTVSAEDMPPPAPPDLSDTGGPPSFPLPGAEFALPPPAPDHFPPGAFPLPPVDIGSVPPPAPPDEALFPPGFMPPPGALPPIAAEMLPPSIGPPQPTPVRRSEPAPRVSSRSGGMSRSTGIPPESSQPPTMAPHAPPGDLPRGTVPPPAPLGDFSSNDIPPPAPFSGFSGGVAAPPQSRPPASPLSPPVGLAMPVGRNVGPRGGSASQPPTATSSAGGEVTDIDVRNKVKVIGRGALAREIRELTPEEKERRRMRRSLTMMILGVLILVGAMMWLSNL